MLQISLFLHIYYIILYLSICLSVCMPAWLSICDIHIYIYTYIYSHVSVWGEVSRVGCCQCSLRAPYRQHTVFFCNYNILFFEVQHQLGPWNKNRTVHYPKGISKTVNASSSEATPQVVSIPWVVWLQHPIFFSEAPCHQLMCQFSGYGR